MCLFVAAIRTRAGLLTLQQQGAAEPHESPSIAEHQNPPLFSTPEKCKKGLAKPNGCAYICN